MVLQPATNSQLQQAKKDPLFVQPQWPLRRLDSCLYFLILSEIVQSKEVSSIHDHHF